MHLAFGGQLPGDSVYPLVRRSGQEGDTESRSDADGAELTELIGQDELDSAGHGLRDGEVAKRERRAQVPPAGDEVEQLARVTAGAAARVEFARPLITPDSGAQGAPRRRQRQLLAAAARAREH